MSEEKLKKEEKEKVITKETGDKEYLNEKDWRVYNPDKYNDPNWSPDLE